ncbi:MAG TPA: addiction module antidote protein, HigA family [Rhodospirillaceae bacterium]|nr:MAG: addiction module antidote protein, HigA family [Alphaproteobacteria bacterium GWF2_58_20]HAU29786.1 addiction module antidote protein, HigA family [Rhodospirillaceae bacterium]
MTEGKNSFEPNWASPPGDTILDRLEEFGWNQRELATRLGMSPKHVNQVIKGREQISDEMAEKLATVLGSTPKFWIVREAQYRIALSRLEKRQVIEDTYGEWLKELPVKHMLDWNWIRPAADKADKIGECLRFFGVATLDAWQSQYAKKIAATAFRASDKCEKKVGAIAAWLRQGEILASRVECRDYDKEAFSRALDGARTLTREPDPAIFLPKLKAMFASCGVAVVAAPAPTGCPASGAAWWQKGKGIILLSFRHKTDDHFWFSFFHEAAHILLHGRRDQFIDVGVGTGSKEEQEADEFARRHLIPDEVFVSLRANPSVAAISVAADRLGIAPGIIVGSLQHVGSLPYSALNGMKHSYEWVKPAVPAAA